MHKIPFVLNGYFPPEFADYDFVCYHFKKEKKMKRFFVLILSIFVVASAISQENTNLSKQEVSPLTLRSILSSNYSNNELDSDGDLLIRKDGISIFVFVDTERELLKFRTQWSSSDSISENRAIKIVNNWNNDKIFSKAIYSKKRFRLEYDLTFMGGINSINLNDSLDWFFSIAQGFGNYLSEEDAI